VLDNSTGRYISRLTLADAVLAVLESAVTAG
jgi:hypothetical protein